MKRFIKGAILATMFLGSYAAITEITHPTAYVAEASLLDTLKGEAQKYDYAYSNLDWWYQPQGKCTFVKTTDGIMDVRGHHPKAKGKVVETGAILKLSNGKTGYVNKSTIPPDCREYLYLFSDAGIFYIKCNNGKIYQYRNFEYGDVGLWYIDSYGYENSYGLEEGTFTRTSLSGNSSGGSSSSSGSKPKPNKPNPGYDSSGKYNPPRLVNVCGKFNKKKFKANKVYEMKYWETEGGGKRKYVKLYDRDKYIGRINFKNVEEIEATYYYSKFTYVVNNKKAITYKDKHFDRKKGAASKYIGKQIKSDEEYSVGRKRYHSLYCDKKWIGYMDDDDLNWVYDQKKVRQPILMTKNHKAYKDLGKINKKPSVKKGQAFIAKRAYTLYPNKPYYSIYATDSKGEEKWQGYVYGDIIEGKEDTTPRTARVIKKNSPIWNDLGLTQKKGNANSYIGKTVTVKSSYDFGDGKIRYAICKGNKWLGYMDSSSIDVVEKEEPINETVIVENQPFSIWKDLHFKNKVENVNVNKAFLAKDAFKLNDGNIYYSLLEKTNNGWDLVGYINSKGTKKVDSTYLRDNLTATVKNTNSPIWNDIYQFKEMGTTALYSDQKVQLSEKFVFPNNETYYSVSKDNHFIGYMNKKALDIQDNRKYIEFRNISCKVYPDLKNKKTIDLAIKTPYILGNQIKYFNAKGDYEKDYYEIFDQQKKFLGYATPESIKNNFIYTQLNLYTLYGSFHFDDCLSIYQLTDQDLEKIKEIREKIYSSYLDSDYTVSFVDDSIQFLTELFKNIKLKGWKYTEDYNSIHLQKYVGTEEQLIIPGLFKDKKVYIESQPFENNQSLKKIKFIRIMNKKAIAPKDMSNFFNIPNLEVIEAQELDFSNVENMSHLFGKSISYSPCDIEKWDVSNVKNMSEMFHPESDLKSLSSFSTWNTQNVTDMSYMFKGCKNLTNLSGVENWDTSKVKNMKGMFEDCENIEDISPLKDWNVSKVIDMSYMFSGCRKLKDDKPLRKWKYSYNVNRYNMFLNTLVR